ncbi:MAG: LysR family transcriptional regulator [Chloroflexi bacterium]|nr:MAG: LysR family transcriptional regulator [Chloroflexota bacterium]
MSITLRQLEIFIAVAETAQVTKASKKLFVTQSAVSMALAELENQLGGELFDRRGRSLLLNERGRYLLPLAKEVTAKIGSIEVAMSERSESLQGELNIVASTTLGNYIMPYLIGAFKRMQPRVHVNLLVFNTKAAEKLVLENKMDVGFVEGQISASEKLAWRPWFHDELVVLCGATDPLVNKEVFDIKKDLPGRRWVMRETGSGTMATITERFGEYMKDVNVVMEVGHPEGVKRAVESGAGIACLSSLSICREVEYGWLKALKIAGLDMRRQLRVIQRKDWQMSDAMAAFVDFCDVMSVCGDSQVCLSSPWKLQSLLARYSAVKKRG